MEESDIDQVQSDKLDVVGKVLKKFIDANLQTFTFDDLNPNGKRKKLWNALFYHLGNPRDPSCHKYCLTSVRILSRDKTDLNDLICNKWLDILLHHAGLVSEQEALTQINEPVVDYSVVLESLKCLCNLIFNSTTAQSISSKNHSVEGVVMRLRTYRDRELPHEIKFFDMKLLFLITALSADVRPRLKEQFHGLTYLMETLDLILKEAGGDDRGATNIDIHITLSDDQILLAIEVLKVLFNLTAKKAGAYLVYEEADAHFLRLASILHDLLLCGAESPEKQVDLRVHTVNLLMCIPITCYEELTTPLQSDAPHLAKELEYDGRSMEAISVLLEFLDNRLTNALQGVKYQQESLSPILTVLLGGARTHRLMRKWLRAQILPPLNEVRLRPEEGTTLRNKLCRLLTSPITPVRDLAADLLFVLCKENVIRMVKYTGYGNAAGLLANRGLMLGGANPSSCNFSSDSEDSDTEEYKKYRNQINPVTGCVEPPHDNPVATMSDEQKEYEAMKLVNMMDKLARDGIVQPCRIGQDGRPEPVDHILQMIENVPNHNRED